MKIYLKFLENPFIGIRAYEDERTVLIVALIDCLQFLYRILWLMY
jgi:hypothetical protein